MVKKTLTLSLFLMLSYVGLTQPRDSYVYRQSPVTTSNQKINELLNRLNGNLTNNQKLKIYRELGVQYFFLNYYETSNYYLYLSKGYVEEQEPKISDDDLETMKADQKFLDDLPKSYDDVPKEKMVDVQNMIDKQIEKLIQQREELLQREDLNPEVLKAKDGVIKSLGKEKEIVNLSIIRENLKIEKSKFKNYLMWALAGISLLVLALIVLLQKKTIKVKDGEIEKQLDDINKKNTYLEHAAKIIRHDMHSGINTYIPRGLSSLERRLKPEDIENMKLEGALKMMRDGLTHTQKVYKSVYEFTNLVKQNVVLEKTLVSLKELLTNNIAKTSYGHQVIINDLTTIEVNETLFWVALDNLIKNGLRYNYNEDKKVIIFMEGDNLVIQDNGVGLSKKDFETIIKSNTGKEESGLGLSICNAIIVEHGFELDCEKLDIGTKLKIKLNKKS